MRGLRLQQTARVAFTLRADTKARARFKDPRERHGGASHGVFASKFGGGSSKNKSSDTFATEPRGLKQLSRALERGSAVQASSLSPPIFPYGKIENEVAAFDIFRAEAAESQGKDWERGAYTAQAHRHTGTQAHRHRRARAG